MSHNSPEFFLVFLVVVAMGALYGYGVSSWLMRRRVNTWLWALLCFLAYMAFSCGSWFAWHDGEMGGPSVIGCLCGGSLARGKYLERKR